MQPKILITSIPSWNERSGSNTFSTLFAAFPPEQLANIFIADGMPSSHVCARYFYIDEMAVVKSVVCRGLPTGREVSVVDDEAGTTAAPRRRVKRLRVLLWTRELAWKLGGWKSAELEAFLDDFRPDVLVFPIEGYPYFNRLNLHIIRRCQPKKVVGYLWDDNFTYRQHPRSLLFLLERFFLRRQVRQLVGACTDVLAISPKMKEECDQTFGISSVVLTKPIVHQGPFRDFEVGSPVRILYTGKLIIGRWETIAKVAAAIKTINREGQKVRLDVYTQTPLTEKQRQLVHVPGCCELHAPVPQAEVVRLQKGADVLLFAEALSDCDLTARLSFSTKLTDYLAAGKCVWGVGNADLGPICYIRSEHAGFVSTSDEEINEVLNTFVAHPDAIRQMARRGYECGVRNHNKEKVMKTLKHIILTPTGGGKQIELTIRMHARFGTRPSVLVAA